MTLAGIVAQLFIGNDLYRVLHRVGKVSGVSLFSPAIKHFPVRFFLVIFLFYASCQAVLWYNHIFQTEGSGTAPTPATHSLFCTLQVHAFHLGPLFSSLHSLFSLVCLSPRNVNFRVNVLYIGTLTKCTHGICVYVVFFLLVLPALWLPSVYMYVGNGTRPPGYDRASGNWSTELPKQN